MLNEDGGEVCRGEMRQTETGRWKKREGEVGR